MSFLIKTNYLPPTALLQRPTGFVGRKSSGKNQAAAAARQGPWICHLLPVE